MSEKVLVVGSGGREHALAWKIAESPHVDKVFVAPGNGGTSQVAENVPIDCSDLEGLVEFAENEEVGLTVVGPDDPLAFGIVDVFREKSLRIFGPTQRAAMIEASKAFSKELMHKTGIPTAEFQVFQNFERAREYARDHGAPVVVKASGLALGKGVYICHTVEKAESALSEIMVEGVHETAGEEVVIEDFLEGQEVSIHAISDGKTYVLLPPAQDHKPVHDNDEGKNTGGMGTITPLSWVSAETMSQIDKEIVSPTLRAMAARGREFSGVLYPGLIMTTDGPKVIEFNARFGDPETQSYMRLLKSDLYEILDACVDGRLDEVSVEWEEGFAACVVLASGGYPDAYKKGLPIRGIDSAESLEGVVVFHAGTTDDNGLKTTGGRVLGVTAVGKTLPDALDLAYEAADRIKFEGKQNRTDIGRRRV